MAAAGSRTEPATAGDLFAGKYRFLRALGKGGMGEVWLAEEEGPRGFRRRVAVKKLLARADLDEYAQESFFAEAQVIARLDHPNIVRLIELGVADDTVFLVLDYVDGPSLDRLIKKGGGPLSPIATAYVGREIARALEAVHGLADDNGASYGVVHRDISPSNVLISRDGRVRLADFGIAKISGLGAEKTATGVFKGKLQYMPPEQARGEPFDGRADIFSLGVTLQEAMLGKRLRKAETQAQMMIQVATTPLPYVRDLLPDIPAVIADAIDRAAEFDPSRRTSDAGSLAADLDRALRSQGLTAEQDARDEIRRRVEATLVALGEPVTGAHVRRDMILQTARSPSAPPIPTSPAGISEIHARDAKGAGRGPGEAVGGAPPTRPSPVLIHDQGPPSSQVPTVLERPSARRPPGAPPPPAEGAMPEGRSAQAESPSGLPARTAGSGARAPSLGKAPPRRGPILALLALAAAVGGGVALWRGLLPADAPVEPPIAGSAVVAPPASIDPAAIDPPVASAMPVPAEPGSASASSASAADPPPATGAPRGQTRPGTPRGTSTAPGAPATAAVDAAAPGTLQVVVLPWADVSVDGRSAGTTPLAPIPLPPGPHTVVLRNAELGATRTLSVIIKPGAPTSLRVDLRRTEKP